jgi:hypothetical protein
MPEINMSIEEARALLLEIDKTANLTINVPHEEWSQRYSALSAEQQHALEMDRWLADGWTSKDSIGVQIRYEFTIRAGEQMFGVINGREVAGSLVDGRFVPLQ